MRMRFLSIFPAWIFVIALLNGCSPHVQEPRPQLEDFPQRIICTSPALTEIIFFLGGAPQVIAVSDYVTWPEEALSKPRIGGVWNPNLEQILSLQPDLLLLQGNAETLTTFAKTHRISTEQLPLDTLADIEAAMKILSGYIADQKTAQDALQDWQETISRYSMFAQNQISPPPSLAWLMGHIPGGLQGMATVGAKTFLSECIALAGGSNAFADVKGAWPLISREILLAHSPELLLEIHPNGLTPQVQTALQQDWKNMGIPSEKVVFLTNDYLLIPGPRITHILQTLTDLLPTPP